MCAIPCHSVPLLVNSVDCKPAVWEFLLFLSFYFCCVSLMQRGPCFKRWLLLKVSARHPHTPHVKTVVVNTRLFRLQTPVSGKLIGTMLTFDCTIYKTVLKIEWILMTCFELLLSSFQGGCPHPDDEIWYKFGSHRMKPFLFAGWISSKTKF